MKQTQVAVVGAGPAGLSAAIAAASHGAYVTLIDRNSTCGGQLIKQTHKFFGSKKEYAGTRGIQIGETLGRRVMEHPGIEVWLEATALGFYSDRVLTVEKNDRFYKIHVERLIIAAGASEKMLLFPNNDLPGVYGAGAVQTLMNVYGVMPARRVLMVGAGNIGLIVSYQLLQAGVEVAAVIEAAPRIGGYAVHASKIRRLGIPIYTSHSIKEAQGSHCVEKAIVWQVGPDWKGVPGTEMEFDVDAICLAVGLQPLTELLWQAGCRMLYIPELGGYVAAHDDSMETSVPGVYVAGDASGIEEASSAMLTGRIAGLSAAHSLGLCPNFEQLKAETMSRLDSLRSGPTGAKIGAGLARMAAMRLDGIGADTSVRRKGGHNNA